MGSKLTRRQALASIGGAAIMGLTGEQKLWAAQDSPGGGGVKRLCRPFISGTLWGLEASTTGWSESEWRDELDRQRKIGFDLIWLFNTAHALTVPGDPIKRVLDLCDKRKVRVILDCGSSKPWTYPLDVKQELESCRASVKQMGERYAGHPAFKYWYIPHEINTAQDKRAEDMDALYTGVVESCKKTADLPVTVSPWFCLDSHKLWGEHYAEPDEYEQFWARQIKRSGFDIVMMQDSGEHFSFSTIESRRPFFRAMQGACKSGGAKFWGNVECAEVECPSVDEYLKRYGKVYMHTVRDLRYRPVPIDRMKSKLDLASEYCQDIVTWGYREICRPVNGPAGAKWYEDYLGYYQGSVKRRV